MAEHGDRPRIVIVDDEDQLREMVAEYLGGQGFAVRAASGGKAFDRLIEEEPADLVILDVNMPEEDGFSIARRVRATGRTPIIMLTASDDVVDKIVGLELGADDYVTKPFDLRELKARIRAVLRRVAERPARPVAPPAPEPAATSSLVEFGKLFVDRDMRMLVHPDGRLEQVTTMEFELIDVFLQNPHRVLSRDRLLDLAHRKNDDPFDRSIDIRITRLRKKIEEDPARPTTIKTVRGAGYMYSPGKRQ